MREREVLPKTALLKEYYTWLCDLAGANQEKNSYFMLIKDMYRYEFTWTVPNDDNRAFEGMNLREIFCHEHLVRFEKDKMDGAPRFLEVVLALAMRIDDLMQDSDDDYGVRGWFWVMMDNSGLSRFTDEEYYDHGGTEKVYSIMEKIVRRDYHRNGRGGLFPLKFHKKDQRKTELWYQMNEYLVENYYTENV